MVNHLGLHKHLVKCTLLLGRELIGNNLQLIGFRPHTTATSRPEARSRADLPLPPLGHPPPQLARPRACQPPRLRHLDRKRTTTRTRHVLPRQQLDNPHHTHLRPPLAQLALHPNHPPHQRWTRTTPTNPSSHTSNPTQNTRHPRQHQPLHAPNTRHTHEKKFVVEKSIYKRITPNYYQV